MSLQLSLQGRARVFGDDINTDYIISSRRKRDARDEEEMARFLFEDIDPAFAASLERDDIIVAGKNFGCGSAMEVAVTVARAAGIRAIVAKSFARTFYRNAINNGLLPVIADTGLVKEGSRIEIAVAAGSTVVILDEGARRVPAQGIPPELVSIFTEGGLVLYIAKHRGFAIPLPR
ncbi:MAG: alpha-IPM isomerase [Hyphomicrobiales bacterium]|nr:alpha-IPM isomerase [Hyphomicrobiales bacterium]